MLNRAETNPEVKNNKKENKSSENIFFKELKKIYSLLSYLCLLAKDIFSLSPKNTSDYSKEKGHYQPKQKSVIKAKPSTSIIKSVKSKTKEKSPVQTISDPKKINYSSKHSISLYNRNNDPYHFYTNVYGIPPAIKKNKKS